MRIHENLGPICSSMDSGGSGWGQVCDFSGRSLLIIIPGRMAGAVEALEIMPHEKQQKAQVVGVGEKSHSQVLAGEEMIVRAWFVLHGGHVAPHWDQRLHFLRENALALTSQLTCQRREHPEGSTRALRTWVWAWSREDGAMEV